MSSETVSNPPFSSSPPSARRAPRSPLSSSPKAYLAPTLLFGTLLLFSAIFIHTCYLQNACFPSKSSHAKSSPPPPSPPSPSAPQAAVQTLPPASLAAVIPGPARAEEQPESTPHAVEQAALPEASSKSAGDDASISSAPPTFVPTDEWQELLPNQAIPPGLHVQIDMTTGARRAKRLSPDADDSADSDANVEVDTQHGDGHAKSLALVGDGALPTSDALGSNPSTASAERSSSSSRVKVTSLSKEEIRRKLAKMSEEHPEAFEALPGTEVTGAPHSEFRSADELKKEMEELEKDHVFARADVQTMHRLLDVMRTTGDENLIVNALYQLGDLVDQVDNGRDLDLIGGLEFIVQLLNHSSTAVKMGAALILGTSTQNNPEAQLSAVSRGTLRGLLPLLDSPKAAVRRRGLYAISSLVRNCRDAQVDFVRQGGVQRLLALLSDADVKLATRAVVLVTDLVDELSLSSGASVRSGEVAQLRNSLTAPDVCDAIASMLLRESLELDTCEKAVIALDHLHAFCVSSVAEWSEPERQTRKDLLRRVAAQLRTFRQGLSSGEDAVYEQSLGASVEALAARLSAFLSRL